MAQVIAIQPTLSDSTFKSRPNFQQFLRTDANAGPNNLRQIELRRLARQRKFPTLSGRGDVDSFQATIKHESGFKKYNDEGDHRPDAPNRDNVTLIDPVSGFVAVGADVDRQTGRKRIKSMVQLNLNPPATVPPQRQTLIRNNQHAPPELQRAKTFTEGLTPTAWESKQLSDVQIRANLGGWTSKKDPRTVDTVEVPGAKPDGIPKTEQEEKEEMKNKLASNYIWKTSSERAYAQVPWDRALPPKLYPPTTTVEPKPDQISQKFSLKRYNPTAEDWQTVGRAWDWFQTRRNNSLYRPADYCEFLPRAQHIPGYSGCVGADNVVHERDNRAVTLEPYTVKRNVQPWRADTAARPNIPHYTGCTLYRSQTCMPKTTASSSTPREFPVSARPVEHARESHMSKMIRTVPPHNPFNSVQKPMPVAT